MLLGREPLISGLFRVRGRRGSSSRYEGMVSGSRKMDQIHTGKNQDAVHRMWLEIDMYMYMCMGVGFSVSLPHDCTIPPDL
jgi:hypothetical protein